MTIRPNAIEMKPRSAPEKGAFVPPSSNRIAGTDPAPTKTSSAVPTASANARCAAENVSISVSSRAGGRGRGPIPRFPRASSLGNDIRHDRTSFGERTTRHEVVSSGICHKYLTEVGLRGVGAPRSDRPLHAGGAHDQYGNEPSITEGDFDDRWPASSTTSASLAAGAARAEPRRDARREQPVGDVERPHRRLDG